MPRWSPDGARLAFVSTRDQEHGQLYVIPVAGGEPRRLTDFKEAVEEVAWSPDGSRLAFTARVPDDAYKEEDEKKRPIPEADLRSYYEQHRSEFVIPTRVRVSHLFIAAPEKDPRRARAAAVCRHR